MLGGARIPRTPPPGGGARITRTPPPGPSTPRRSPPSAAARPAPQAELSFTQLGRTRTRPVVTPRHLADFDCSSGEEPRRRTGRARASDLWTQPGQDGGGDKVSDRDNEFQVEVAEGEDDEGVNDVVVVSAEDEQEEEADVVNGREQREEVEPLPDQEVDAQREAEDVQVVVQEIEGGR